MAILSSYVIEQEWLEEMLENIPKVHLILDNGRKKRTDIMHLKPGWTASFPPFPSFPAYGVMHSKMMILFYKDWMRIIISSSNLCKHDFTVVENIAYIEDFPLINDLSHCDDGDGDLHLSTINKEVGDHQHNTEKENIKKDINSTPFKEDLKELLKVLHVPQEILRASVFDDYLFTSKNDSLVCRIVWSVPGMHRCDSGNCKIGIERLLSISNVKVAKVECQGSSLGFMGPEFLKDFLTSIGPSLLRNQLRIVFPTKKYALSNGGISMFGTIFCKEKYFQPKELFYRCIAEGGRPLHSKIISCWTQDDKLSSIYVGSANFTPSAWGRKVKGGTHLLVSNYELGVYIKGFDGSPSGKDILIPYKRDPLQKYSIDDVPWIQEDFDNMQ